MRVFKFIMIGCKEATLLSSKQTETSLSPAEKIRLKVHTMICKPCLYFSKQVKLIHNSLKNLAGNTTFSFTEMNKADLQKKINESL